MEDPMTAPPLLRHDDGGIATLTMNRPATLNALSGEMLAAFEATLAAVAADDGVRVVLLRGPGRAFCAGHDLREMQAARSAPDGGRAAHAALFATCARVMQALVALPQPVVAEVQGIATAAGCQLAASCDLVVAAETARFGVNGVNIGLFCTTPMVALTRKVPPAVAFEMLATGEFLAAPRAREAGLVNRVVPEADLPGAARALAETLAGKLPAALRLGKAAFRAQSALPLAEAYALAGARMVENLCWRDTDEGMAAFLEKRRPDWA
jgi:enoyl-CoA hydratase/carnithine racemase